MNCGLTNLQRGFGSLMSYQLPRYIQHIPDDLLPSSLRLELSPHLKTFNRARDQLVVCLGRYLMYRDMKMKLFPDIKYSLSYAPFVLLSRSLEATLLVKLLSVWDQDEEAIMLSRVKNALLTDKALPELKKSYCGLWDPNNIREQRFNLLVTKLNRMSRQLNRGTMKIRVDILKTWRDKFFAHSTIDDSLRSPPPINGEIDVFFIFTIRYFLLLEEILVHHKPDYKHVLDRFRDQSDRLHRSVKPIALRANVWHRKYNDPAPKKGYGWGFIFFQKQVANGKAQSHRYGHRANSPYSLLVAWRPFMASPGR